MSCKIGIIGGASALASAHLYQEIVRQFISLDLPIPEMVILNYPFTLGLKLKDSTENDATLKRELEYCIDSLRHQEVNLLMLGCNTLHYYLSQLNLKGIELVSIPGSVASFASNRQKKKLFLFATETSVNKGIYQHTDIGFVTPNPEEQIAVDAILDRILINTLHEKDRDSLCAIAMSAAGRKRVDGIVLGCTDFHILHRVYPIMIPMVDTLDSIRIAAQTLIQTYLEKQ